MSFETRPFGVTENGDAVQEYAICANGMCARFIDHGAALRSLQVPDKDGKLTEVVLGYDTLAQYEHNDAYLGVTVGRFANRIGGAEFSLNGTTYRLNANEGVNQLHGGPTGFHTRMWQAECFDNGIRFTRLSPDGEENYPGNLQVSVTFTLTEARELRIEYDAVSDQDTVVNLTNHSYFNLNGGGTVLEHSLWLNAERITELGEGSIPTGRYIDVEGTPFDFRVMKPIGRDIDAPDAQLAIGSGYDHNFVLGGKHAATLRGDRSGIEMKLYTDMPGVQFYSANCLGERKGSFGRDFFPRCAAALETQLFPHAMRCYGFPSPVLRAGVQLHSETKYSFSIY